MFLQRFDGTNPQPLILVDFQETFYQRGSLRRKKTWVLDVLKQKSVLSVRRAKKREAKRKAVLVRNCENLNFGFGNQLTCSLPSPHRFGDNSVVGASLPSFFRMKLDQMAAYHSVA
jgi:hypothetical protein